MIIKEITLRRTIFELIIAALILHPSTVNATANVVYIIGGSGVGTVQMISIATNTVIGTITIPGASSGYPNAIAITPNNQYAYITDSSLNQIYVLNLVTNTYVTTITGAAFNNPLALAITPDGNYVFVVNAAGFSFSIIATATNTVVSGSPFSTGGNEPFAIAINSAGTTAYLAILNSNKVVPVNISTPTSP